MFRGLSYGKATAPAKRRTEGTPQDAYHSGGAGQTGTSGGRGGSSSSGGSGGSGGSGSSKPKVRGISDGGARVAGGAGAYRAGGAVQSLPMSSPKESLTRASTAADNVASRATFNTSKESFSRASTTANSVASRASAAGTGTSSSGGSSSGGGKITTPSATGSSSGGGKSGGFPGGGKGTGSSSGGSASGTTSSQSAVSDADILALVGTSFTWKGVAWAVREGSISRIRFPIIEKGVPTPRGSRMTPYTPSQPEWADIVQQFMAAKSAYTLFGRSGGRPPGRAGAGPGRFAPSAAGGTPAPEETPAPSGGETAPPPGGETAPPSGGETAPPPGGETTPPPGGETPPSGSGGGTPSTMRVTDVTTSEGYSIFGPDYVVPESDVPAIAALADEAQTIADLAIEPEKQTVSLTAPPAAEESFLSKYKWPLAAAAVVGGLWLLNRQK